MTDLNQIRKVTFVSDTSGLDKARVSTDQLTAAQKNLTSSGQSVAVIQDTQAKSAVSAATRLDAYTRSLDPAAQALRKVETGERLIAAARAQGLPVSAAAINALQSAKQKHEELTKAVNAHTQTVGLNRNQMMESVHVAKAFADSVIAGQSPLRALAVEGGRIGQIFTEGSGGVGGTLKAFGGIVGGLLTGWVGLTAGIVGGLALAGAAVVRFQGQQERLALSLNGVGRAAGVSLSGLTGIANSAGARNPALGQGGATDLAATLAGTGRISSGMMGGIMDMATPYARGTGQDMAKAGEELAKAFADPSKGAELLNEKLGFLDATTKEHIESLQRQGNLLGAQQELLSKAADASARMADTTWTIAKGWESIASSVGSAFSRVGGAIESLVNGPTLAETLQAELNPNASMRGPRGGAGMRPDPGAAGRIEALRYGIAYQEYGQSRLSGGSASDKLTNDLSIQITDAIRKALPDEDRVKQLTDTLRLLDDALKNPETLGKVPGGRGTVQASRDITQNQLTFNDPMRRIQDDSRLAIEAAKATTLAERERVEAERAYLQMLRDGKTEVLAAAAAEAKRNEMLAQANRELRDAVRDSSRELAMSGMNPHERGMARIGFQMQDLQDRVGGGVSNTSPAAAASGASPAWAAGVNAELVRRTEALLASVPGLSVISSYRSTAKQAELYAELHGTGHPVAYPGTSLHEQGFAIDLGGSSAAISRARAAAGQYGLAFPVPGDINHMQLAGGAAPANSNVPVGASGGVGTVKANLEGAFRNQELQPIRDANTALDQQRALLDIQASAGGRTAAATQGLLDRQKLLNELNSQSVPITQSVITQLDEYRQRSEGLAKAQEQLALSIQNADTIRSGARDSLHTFVNDLVAGKGAATAFKDAMEQLGKKLLDSSLDRMIDMLLGKQGSAPGTGLLGGLLGGGAAGGSSGGGLLSFIPKLFGFADGGIMTNAGPLPLRRYADGGIADSPQVAMFGEGSGPEAYIPLKNGGIPVHVKGGGGGNVFHIGGPVLQVQGSIEAATLPAVQAMMGQALQKHQELIQRNLPSMLARSQGRWVA